MPCLESYGVCIGVNVGYYAPYTSKINLVDTFLPKFRSSNGYIYLLRDVN